MRSSIMTEEKLLRREEVQDDDAIGVPLWEGGGDDNGDDIICFFVSRPLQQRVGGDIVGGGE